MTVDFSAAIYTTPANMADTLAALKQRALSDKSLAYALRSLKAGGTDYIRGVLDTIGLGELGADLAAALHNAAAVGEAYDTALNAANGALTDADDPMGLGYAALPMPPALEARRAAAVAAINYAQGVRDVIEQVADLGWTPDYDGAIC